MILPSTPNRYDPRDQTVMRQALEQEAIQLRAFVAKLQAATALPADATDLASALALVNAIKAALIAAGFAS